MRALVWNCQGLGGSLAISQLEEFCKFNSPDLVFLCETKNKSSFIRKSCSKLHFCDFIAVDPVGLAGGMALLWQQGISISSIHTTHCTIEVKIDDPTLNLSWWFVGIYASPYPAERRNCWSFIADRIALWGNHFVIAGDFNDILSSSEKLGGVQRSVSSMRDFRNFVNANALFDLGFQGQFWTWKRTQDGHITTLERLDRFLCSSDWQELFPKFSCSHIYSIASDHCMLLGDTNPLNARRSKSFVFDQRWVEMEGFQNAVVAGWNTSFVGSNMYKFMKKIKAVRIHILKWKGSKTFNSANKIADLKAKLKNAVNDSSNPSKILAIGDELKEAYRQEELFWSQKARISWLRCGDKNSKFFHAAVSSRRRRNHISALKVAGSDTWCQSINDISHEFSSFYSSLFCSSGVFDDLDRHFECISVKITPLMNQSLMQPISEKEVKNAVFGTSSHSAPGPDGWTSSTKPTGGGTAVFDKNYNLVEIWGRSFLHIDSALRAEAETVRWSLLVAKEKGWDNILIKTDSLNLVNMVNGSFAPPQILAIVSDIQFLVNSFRACSIYHVNRKCNLVSHHVAMFAKKLVTPAFRTGVFPAWVVSLKREEEAARLLHPGL